MRIRELWRYPVKSVGGERVTSVRLGAAGIEGDRRWGVQDLETQMVLTGRRTPALLFASARYEGPGEVVITLPDGTETAEDDVLSAWLGRDVHLLAPGDSGGTYECPIDPGSEQEWVQWQGPPGSFHDSAKSMVSLVSEASLGQWPLRRFRTNVLLSGAGEDDWIGSKIRLGEKATIQVIKQIDRCVMITRAQPGLDADLGLLKYINATRATFLSVGAQVRIEGEITEGDEVAVL